MSNFSLTGKRVWVAGHRGMVGSAMLRRLEQMDCEILTASRDQLDLRNDQATLRWMMDHRPQVVVLAAAKAGGIMAHRTRPVDFLLDNMRIEMSVMAGAHAARVEKLLFLASSAVYPRDAPQPLREETLMTGLPDASHHGYALAKLSGMALCEAYRRQEGCDFISALPTNLYGPGDKFDLDSGHVMPSLIRKVHEARAMGSPITVWGTGSPRREFLYVDDCVDACLHLLYHYSGSDPINLGFGEDVSILEATHLVMRAAGYDAPILHDLSKPDGAPRRLMDSSRLRALGWRPSVPLAEGISRTFTYFERNIIDANIC